MRRWRTSTQIFPLIDFPGAFPTNQFGHFRNPARGGDRARIDVLQTVGATASVPIATRADAGGVVMLVTSKLNQRIAHLELPERMRGLKISDEGYPVPWFVGYPDGPDGKEDFRSMDGEKMGIAVRLKRCWMCGQPLGKFMTFALGSMCIVNRNIAEPPSHLACLEYSVRACPFLTQPRMRRNEKDLPEGGTVAGIGLKRNPGVTALWTTLSYRAWRPPGGGVLFDLGDPEHIEFYAEGRRATREEILASMESGLPLLMEIAEAEGPEAVTALQAQYAKAMELLPTETKPTKSEAGEAVR
jgi:hypothetical protein